MPIRRLAAKPSLDHLRSEARRLLEGRAAGDARACQRVREFYPKLADASDAQIRDAKLSWSDGLFIIAREHGFASWTRLRSAVLLARSEPRTDCYLARITDPSFRSAVLFIEGGDYAALSGLLDREPGLLKQRAHFEGENYFRNPSLLAFIVENPIRTEQLPPNITEIAKLLLQRGAAANQADLDETLGLVASGRVPREAGVQRDLIEILCSAGANPDTAVVPALAHGELEAAQVLLECGATTTLATAAAFGETHEARRLLPAAKAGDRHVALALAAQHGQAELLEDLLRSGENPNRYNPVGLHAHSTPLHQAAYNGHERAVRVLLNHGADPSMQDVMWDATPLGWAIHAGRSAIAALLASAGG